MASGGFGSKFPPALGEIKQRPPDFGTGGVRCQPFAVFGAISAASVAPGAHAIMLLDQAGWHGASCLRAPGNISLLPLPPRSPELNAQENIWQFMRQIWLSNRIFTGFDNIVDLYCDAWNRLTLSHGRGL